jgi:hypothetical protein
MFPFAVWIALGALVGSLVGIYRCSPVSQTLPSSGHSLHVGFCAGLGAIAGFLVFAALAIFYYGPLQF